MALYLFQHQIDDPLSISTPKSYRILRHALCKHLGINNLRNLSNSCIELHSNPCTLGGLFYIQICRIRRMKTQKVDNTNQWISAKTATQRSGSEIKSNLQSKGFRQSDQRSGRRNKMPTTSLTHQGQLWCGPKAIVKAFELALPCGELDERILQPVQCNSKESISDRGRLSRRTTVQTPKAISICGLHNGVRS